MLGVEARQQPDERPRAHARGGLGIDGGESAVHDVSWFDEVLGSCERQDE